jgi:hypothetical protein
MIPNIAVLSVEKGVTTRIKGIARFIVESSPIGTIFKARTLSLKVQSVIGELDLQYFYEAYPTRPRHSKGETQVEYAMKHLEQLNIVKRVATRTWERIK